MFVTILSGVFIYIFSQFFLEMILKPLIRYRESVFMIDAELKFYANKLNTSFELAKEREFLRIVDTIRKLSCELEASYKQIFLRKIYILLNFIPEKGKIGDACSMLVRISNNVGIKNGPPGNYDDVKEIRKLLNIESLND